MECSACGYVIDPFDSECRRCRERGAPAPAAPPQGAPRLGGTAPPYFFAGLERGVSQTRLFRVYSDADALLFIYAGPYQLELVDIIKQLRGEESEQRTQWGSAAVGSAGVGLGAGGAAGAGLGAAAVGIGAGISWLYAKVGGSQLAGRAEVLDAMSLDELRREALTNDLCFRVRADNTSQVEMRPPSTGFFTLDEPGMAGYLNLVHRPTGKWRLKLICQADARDAVREFRRVLGPGSVVSHFPC